MGHQFKSEARKLCKSVFPLFTSAPLYVSHARRLLSRHSHMLWYSCAGVFFSCLLPLLCMSIMRVDYEAVTHICFGIRALHGFFVVHDQVSMATLRGKPGSRSFEEKCY